jgi:hypothetical protein
MSRCIIKLRNKFKPCLHFFLMHSYYLEEFGCCIFLFLQRFEVGLHAKSFSKQQYRSTRRVGKRVMQVNCHPDGSRRNRNLLLQQILTIIYFSRIPLLWKWPGWYGKFLLLLKMCVISWHNATSCCNNTTHDLVEVTCRKAFRNFSALIQHAYLSNFLYKQAILVKFPPKI